LKQIIFLIAAVSLLAGCSANRMQTEYKFGNKLAKIGLWKEAHYRWTRALREGKDTAAVHNNIGIALEFQNRLDEAEKEYKKALELDPDNQYIKRNLTRLKRRKNPDLKPDEAEKKAADKEVKRKGGRVT